MATPQDIIDRALRKIKVLGESETASGQKAIDCFNALNALLDSWSLDLSMIFQEQLENFAWLAGVETRTIGSGGNFNTSRPLEILDAYLRDANNLDSPLGIWGSKRFDQIVSKSLRGWPSVLYYEPGYPLGTLRLAEVPNLDFTLFIRTRKKLARFATLSSTIELPEGYERAMVLNLGIEVADDFDKVITDNHKELANDSLANIRRINLPESVAQHDAALLTHGGGRFSIYRGS